MLGIFRLSGLRWLIALGIFSGAAGCCWIKGHRVPEGITQWQDPSPPKLSLREKAQAYPAIAFWAHFAVLGVGNRVNDNMAYLAFCPLLLLEKDKSVLSPLRRAERRSWEAVSEDRNAFFSFVHAGLVGDPDYLLEKGETPQMGGILRGRQSLFEFPDDKVEWPVDLTREGFDFPRALFNTRKCEPRTTRGVPLFLRSRSASFWASEPFRLTGNLNCRGDWETAGGDYLLAYWMGRYFGFVSDTE